MAMDISGSFDRADGYATLIANDAIDSEDDAVKIRTFLTSQASAGRPTAIFLTSQGGYAELAESVADAIIDPSNHLYGRTGMRNVLIINEECSSGCAIVTAALTSKYDAAALKIVVSPEAKFEFHSPVEVVPEKPGSKKLIVVPYRDLKERQRRIDIQLTFLRQFGVNPEWLIANENVFHQFERTKFSGQDLCEQKSRIIPSSSCTKTANEIVENELASLNNEVQVAEAEKRNKTAARKGAPKSAVANEQSIVKRMETQPAEAERASSSSKRKRR